MTILKKDNGTAAPADAGAQYQMAVDKVLPDTLNTTSGAGSNPVADIDVVARSAPTFADLDNDGDLDLVVGAGHGHLYYYENTGSRSQPDFTERTGAANPLAGIDVGHYSTPAFADLDGDGDLDLVVGQSYGTLNYYENTGSRSQPGFTERTDAADPVDGINVDDVSTPAFADLDGDGDLDLAVGEWDGTLNYYENTGSRSQPGFTERTGAANPLVGIKVYSDSAPTFADLDDDGDLDLVVGEYDGILNYYENTGSRSQPGFTERTGAANPLAGIDMDYASIPAFADLDSDGDLDLVVGKDVGYLNYYENTGTRTEGDFNPNSLKEDNGDAIAGVDTQYTIAVGDIFQGTLNSTSNEDGSWTEDDTDWIRIELTAGTLYRIGVERVGVEDPNGWAGLHISLLGPNGYDILSEASHGGFDGAIDIQSVLTTGTYYIEVNSGWLKDQDRSYEVSVVEEERPEGTYDEIAAYLTDGYHEWEGRYRNAFDVEPGGALTADITALTPASQQFVRWALEAWTSVTSIGFEFVDGDAHITFYDEEETIRGGADAVTSDGEILSSRVNIWKGIAPSNTTNDSYLLGVYIHEIGHALGLGHSGPYNDWGFFYGKHAKFLNDSAQATVMSYFNQEDNTYIEASRATPVTPMIADIIAIQNLYGVPTDINLGDTVYGYRSNSDGYLGLLFPLWTGEGNPFVGIDVGYGSSPTFADLDDDGDLDLFASSWGIPHYYENTGTRNQPNFTKRTDAANPLSDVDVNSSVDPAFADLDDDGDLDLVVGEWNGTLYYYENTGTRSQPGFTERTGAANPFAGIDAGDNSSPTFADLDNDGDLDAVIGGASGYREDESILYYENTGTRSNPTFVVRTGVASPLEGAGAGNSLAPALADLDGDGDLDLVMGEYYGTLNYYENTGSRTEASFTPHSLVGQVALTLYDNGGNDTLDLRTDTADQRVDLRPEGISNVYGLDGNLVIARGTVIEHFIAGSGNDTAIGNTAANRLEGRAGNDFLWGSAGNDILIGGPGADRLVGNSGHDTAAYTHSPTGVTVRLHSFLATGGDATGDTFPYKVDVAWTDSDGVEQTESLPDVEHLTGSAHDDVLAGDRRDNVIDGGAGNDTLYGGPGADRLVGNSGHDTAAYTHSPTGVTVRLHSFSATGGDATGDTFPHRVDVAWTDSDGVEQTESLPDVEHLSGSAHNDVLAGDRRDNVIDGGAGNDTLYGGPGGGDDRLDGGPGNDRLYGGQGRDRLAGGAGDDRLVGGPGADVFVVGPGEGQDTVTDFTDSEDRIDLTAFGLAGIDDLTVATTTDGVALDLTDSGGGTILLADFAMANLDATDFIV